LAVQSHGKEMHMNPGSFPRVLAALAMVVIGGACSSNGGTAPGSGGQTGRGGSASGGTASQGGSTATGGKAASGGTSGSSSASGGSSGSGGTTTAGGAAGSGGAVSSGGTTGPAGGGGLTGSGGSKGSGGSASGTGGSTAVTAVDGGSPDRLPTKPSQGCTNAQGKSTLTTGGSSVASGLPTSTTLKTTIGGTSHEYIIDIPADYDPTHPYRLIFSWYQAYGSDTGNANGLHPANDGPNFDATNYAYYGLHREATAAKDPAIFVAPAGSGNTPWDFTRDSAVFDGLLTLVDANLCIDDNRVFSTGFSFGAMMTYALSITRQTKLRAVVAMAAANYNLPGEPTDSNAAPIAYMGTVGMSDGTCPYINSDAGKTGGKWCAITHAQDNGCTIPTTIPTTTAGSKKYVCYDFEGCKAGYPVKMCTFDGPHTPSVVDDGTNTGDDGLKAFIPPLAWQFISQF
jgi:hypothetical protein